MPDLDREIQRRFDKSITELKEEAEQFKEEAASNPEVVASYLPRLRSLLEATGTDRDEMLIRDHLQRAVLSIAKQKPEALSDDYPDLVSAFLDTRKTRVLTRKLLHECAELRSNDVSIQVITDGLEAAEGEVVDQFEEISDALDAGTEFPDNGATAMALSQRLDDFSDSVTGRQQLVVEAVADGLEEIVRYHAAERGLDPIDALIDLRSEYEAANEPFTYGFVEDGTIADVQSEGKTQGSNDVLRYVVDALVGTALIVTVERTEARFLRIEAILAEQDQ